MIFYTDIDAVLGVWDGERIIEIDGMIETDEPKLVELLIKAGLRSEEDPPDSLEPPEYDDVEEAEGEEKALDEMTYQELRALAKDFQVAGYHEMSVEELRAALKEGG